MSSKTKDVKPVTVAALLAALMAWYEAHKASEAEAAPTNYDLMTYRPRKRNW